MPLSKNTNNAASVQSEPTKSSFRKWVERFLMLTAVIGTVVVCMLYSDLFTRYINPPIPKATLYGKWVEQNVAPYAREVMVLNERGVIVDGSLVATSFEFEGDNFSYQAGDRIRTFVFVGRQPHTEMKLDSDAHYLPVFRIEERAP